MADRSSMKRMWVHQRMDVAEELLNLHQIPDYLLYHNTPEADQGLQEPIPMKSFTKIADPPLSEKDQLIDFSRHEASLPTRRNCQYRNDVFLSFRGDDTRSSFTGHLHDALLRAGVLKTFIDEADLKGGDEIAPSLLEAIERTRISIVILSPNYASSSWCLDELAKILECRELTGQIVLPVFYKMDPSDVRKQSGKYGEALAFHEHKSGQEKVKRWREALTKVASISGWHLLPHQRETDFIQNIVKRVLLELNRKPLHVPKNLIGMEHCVKVLLSLLNMASDDVRMLGICGIGGIGKTTIAETIYNAISDCFDRRSFLSNVRETCEKFSRCGLLQLQERLLSKIMADVDLRLGNVDRGINVMKESLCSRKCLIVIDDVNSLDQLETLCGEHDWFGPGSRVIITTRDEHLLVAHGVDEVYKVNPLVPYDACKLFYLTAFRSMFPEEKYVRLSHNVLAYAKGLPLAIKVLGSFLRGRSVLEWQCALEKLKRVPNGEIFSVLKISFDSLDDFERAIFLDIACFFKGEHVDRVKKILEHCDLYPEIGMQVLADKSLVTIINNKVRMHDLIEEMGKEIVRRESPLEPGKRSRLWFHEDVLHVLTEGTGTKNIEGIKLDLIAPLEVCFSSRAFTKMKRLRFFIARNACNLGDPICFTSELRWLEWPGYTLSMLPFTSGWKKLAGLNMSRSHISQLGEDFRLFQNLRFINFSGCNQLNCIPDLSSMQNLEHLDLEECKSLLEVHQSLGCLQKVTHLNFLNCSSLQDLPSSLELKFLQSLILKGCSQLSKFPDILVEVRDMKELSLDETAIGELPASFGNIVGLQELSLRNCKKLKNISCSIYKLEQLHHVDLSGCSELQKFPELLEEESDSSVLSPVSAFPNLFYLDFQGCSLLEVNFLMSLHCLSTLTYLNLSGNKFTILPKGIGKFTKLQQLNLMSCKELREIVELPQNITHLSAEGCESLCIYPPLSSVLEFHPDESPWLRRIDFLGCHGLLQNPSMTYNMLSIQGLLGNTRVDILHPGREVPSFFQHQSTESVISFLEPAASYPDIAGFAFCAVLGGPEGSQIRANVSCEVQVFVNKERTYGFVEQFPLLEFDHKWLHYVPRRKLWGLDAKLRNEFSRVVVSFAASANAMKCCAFQVVYTMKKVQMVENEQQHQINIKEQTFKQSGLPQTSQLQSSNSNETVIMERDQQQNDRFQEAVMMNPMEMHEAQQIQEAEDLPTDLPTSNPTASKCLPFRKRKIEMLIKEVTCLSAPCTTIHQRRMPSHSREALQQGEMRGDLRQFSHNDEHVGSSASPFSTVTTLESKSRPDDIHVEEAGPIVPSTQS